MDKIKKFFWKIGLIISLEWGLYFLWTKIYRFLRQRKYKGNVPVRTTLKQMREKIRARTWKRDSWRELGDAISYPRYFEEVGENSELGNDCDDFSIWALNAGRENITHNNLSWTAEGLFTVVWIEDDGKKTATLTGHNVALFKTFENGKSILGHVSNWRNGHIYEFSESTYEQVAQHIAFEAGNKKLVAWRLSSPDLKKKVAIKRYI